MRPILTVLGVLLLAAVLFALVGIVSPGQESISTIRVYAPIEHSWNVYHDDDQLHKWVPGVTDVKLLSGTDHTAGARYELTVKKDNARESKMYETITTFEQPTTYGIEYDNDMLAGSTGVEFEGLGDTVTLITTNNKFQGKSWFVNSMIHFFNWTIEKETDKQGEALKLLIEETYIEKNANK